jgi:uncharacterized protein (DUF2461 family)
VQGGHLSVGYDKELLTGPQLTQRLMALNNEKLKALPFLDYLKKIKEYLNRYKPHPKIKFRIKRM